jgi:hypothetical protein
LDGGHETGTEYKVGGAAGKKLTANARDTGRRGRRTRTFSPLPA